MLFIEMENAWVHALKGKRRKCSAFEMMFKKNLMEREYNVLRIIGVSLTDIVMA